MVSTAKSRKLLDRLNAARPYKSKLLEMMRSLEKESENIDSPYLHRAQGLSKVALLVVSANRGLCGAYNTNALSLARQRYEELSSQARACDIYVIGKKGNSYFKFMKLPIKKNYMHIDENFSYAQSEELALTFMRKFREQVYGEIEIVSTVYHSAGSQKALPIPFLPLQLHRSTKETGHAKEKTESPPLPLEKREGNYIFEPEAKNILEALVPLAIKTHFYGIILEAILSEQIARRIAMKNATDAAGEMLKSLVRSYNRARQTSITQELAEIVAGADAI